MTEKNADGTIEIGGVRYATIKNATFAHDIYVMRIVRQHRFNELTMEQGETAEMFAERVCHVAMANGSALDLIGALLTPADVAPEDWTPEIARKTTLALSRVTSDDDKAKMRAQLGSVLAFFLSSVVSTLTISQKSLISPESQREEPHEAAAPPITTTGTSS
jgi:hypothetical protein